MSGSANRWVLRLSTEGADQVIRDLRAAATESAAAGRAYDALIKAQPQLATGAERAEQALRKNIDAMRGMRGELGLVSAAVDGATGSLGRFGPALTSPAAAIAALSAGAVAGLVQIARLGDEYTTTINKLRAATGSLGAAQQVYGELVALSQQTGASISESAGAFVRFSVAARSIGATNGEVLQLTRTIQQAGLISGASTQEAAAGVQQLGQALASGTLQGDELRSILENMPTLAEALAQQLGVSVGQLRSMGSEGQLTSDRVFQALLRASENINKQFTELTPTMGRAFGALGQAMVEFVGKLDQALGLSQAIARAASAAAAAVGGISGAITPRSPAEQADFDVSEARVRRGRLEVELASLNGEPGLYATPRRGTTSRAMQEAAAQTQPRDERLAELRERIEAENTIIRDGLERRNQAHNEADDVRQAEEATAAARRAAARAAETRAAGVALRERNKSEEDLRAAHNTRLADIERNRLAGNFSQAEADRLRASETRKLAEEIDNLREASRGRVTTDQELADVGRIVADIERDRLSFLREGEEITRSVRTETEKYAEQLVVLDGLLSQGAITQETYNRAVAAADPALRRAADAARQVEQANKSTTDAIVRYGAESFADLFGENKRGWQGMLENFQRTARSVFARIAAEAIIRPIVTPIVSSLGLGSLGSSSGLGISSLFGGGGVGGGGAAQVATPGAAGSGLGLGTISSGVSLLDRFRSFGAPGGLGGFFPGGAPVSTGFGWLDGGLNTSLVMPQLNSLTPTLSAGSFLPAGAQGPLLPATLPASTGGLTVAGSLGPLAAIGGGAYAIHSGIQKGGIGGGVGAAGGAVSAVTGGAMLASAAGLIPALGVLGPAGLALGAVLAIASSFLPGQKASGKGQAAYQDLFTGSASTAGLTGDRFSAENRDQAQSAVGQIANLARQIGDALGGLRIGGTVGVGVTSSRGSGPGQLYLDYSGRKAEFANDEEGAKALSERATEFLLDEFRNRAEGDYRGILNASGNSLEKLFEDLDWYKTVYKSFQDTDEAASVFQQSLDAVAAKFQPTIDKANELSLSTDKITAAREKEIAALQKQRNEQLRNITENLALRDTRSTGGASYEAIRDMTERERWRGLQAEIDALDTELKALGLSSADVAAQLERLRRVQGQEYWRAFGDAMANLDRNVIGRILRATGRGGEADMLDFEAAATAEVAALSDSLAQLGLSAEIAATKIAETEQAIGAERIALQKRIADEASEIARQAAEAAAQAQRQAAEEAAAVWERILTAGQSIRAYVDGQRTNTGPGGVSTAQAFAAAQGQFGSDLTLARAGDQDALARITGTADRLLNAGQQQFASGVNFQAVRDFVLASLESLPVTRSYDALILEELQKLGGAVDVEVGITMIRAITEELNALPEAERNRLIQSGEVQRRILQAVLGTTGSALVTPGAIDRFVRQQVETTETVQISRSIDDKIGRLLDALITLGTAQADHLAFIKTDLNHFWRRSLGEGGGVTVQARDWAHSNTDSIVKFAQGGVFDSPVMFPMRGGATGMMGEAGPEAIMPLDRAPDGRLGVRASTPRIDLSGLIAVVRELQREVAMLRAERSADARKLIQTGVRTADATEETAETNATMARSDRIIGRRPRAA